jgi:uncharacterized protein YuzE
MKVTYDTGVDVLRILFRDAPIEESDEDKPGIILDYDKDGNVVSVEVLNASQRVENLHGVDYTVIKSCTPKQNQSSEMKYEINRLPDYSDDALLNELRRVASIVNKDKLTIEDFKKHSRVNVTTLRRRFGSWPSALEKATLSNLCNKVNAARKSYILARNLSNEEILNEVLRVVQIVGNDKINSNHIRQHSKIGVDAIRNRFGSLRSAFRAAGIKETAHGRRYTDEECFENMLRVWTHYGRPPMYREMDMPPSEVGPKAYIVRWGTWNKALHAFVERVNHDTDGSMDKPSVSENTAEQNKPVKRVKEEDCRNIRLGLRYEVLKRDNFRCSLCGASPALTPGVELHVDHIHPFSKGGKTENSNLRALCQACNLGKGAKIEL